jgi:tight adherence protein C
MNPTILVTSLIFLTSVLAIVGLSSYQQTRTQGKIVKRRVGGRLTPASTGETTKPYKEGFTKTLEKIGKVSQSKTEEDLSQIRKMLIRAGYRHARAPMVFFGIKLCMTLVFVIGFAILHFLVLPLLPAQLFLALYVLSATIGFYAPNVFLQSAISNRKQIMVKGIPSSLDLMVVCVEAGLGLDMTIKRVGEEIKLAHRELYEEFQILGLELRTGLTRIMALRNLADRTDLDELRGLVALLVQTDRFGTSLAQALRVHADAMRKARRQRAEELAAKLPVKLLFPLILFIFPSLFVVILGPGIIRGAKVLMPTLAGQ